jgi:tetratricopeptide (TPR) repeat protein
MLRLSGYLCLSAWMLTVILFLCPNLSAQAQTQVAAIESADASSGTAPRPALPAHTPMETGDSLFSQRSYEAAIAAYSAAPQMTAALWNRIGISYEMMNDIAEAVRSYKRSLKIEPNNPLALNNLATIDASRREFGDAEREVRKALKLDPNFALAYMNLGTILISEQKLKQGQDAYAKAMAIDPAIFNARNRPKTDNSAPAHDRGAMNYSIAAACARAGSIECALQYLRSSLNEGYATPGKVAADNQFANIAGNPEFQRLLAEQRNQ